MLSPCCRLLSLDFRPVGEDDNWWHNTLKQKHKIHQNSTMKNDSNYRVKKCLSLIQTSWGVFFGVGHWSDFRTWNSNNILEKYGKSWWSTDSVLRWWIDWCNSGYTMVILPRLWSSPFGLPKKKSPFSTRLVVLELQCQVAPVPHQLGTSSSKLVIGSPIFVSWFCSFPSLIFGILPI